jgi:mannose-6-phosphate isomerase-like protein (cupin superfamily)
MIVEKSWGHEEILANGAYCMKLLVYTRTIASSLHYHERKHETFYVASGAFKLEFGQQLEEGVRAYEIRVLKPGDHLVLPPLTIHRLRCLAPGTVVEASSHDDPNDCVRLEPSES